LIIKRDFYVLYIRYFNKNRQEKNNIVGEDFRFPVSHRFRLYLNNYRKESKTKPLPTKKQLFLKPENCIEKLFSIDTE